MSTSLYGSFQLENAGNFESGSTSASALGWGPLAAFTMCDFSLHVSREGSVWAAFSINYNQNKNIKILNLKR
jgi:hypothetical protein